MNKVKKIVDAHIGGIVWIDDGDPDCDHLHKVGTGHRIDGREIFVCQKCGARCSYPSSLSVINGRQGASLSVVSCAVCGKTVQRRGCRRRKIKGRLRFVCPGCLEDFDSKNRRK